MNGIINVLKPPGMTSNDVVSFIKRTSGIRKVGHTGTLDPGAAGVLPVCIGKATKVVDFIMNDRKTYICELTLGARTDTYDKYGKFLDKKCSDSDADSIGANDLLHVLQAFEGEISQTPPAFSAIRLNGRRAYDMARNGEVFEIPSRKVTIYRIHMLSFNQRKAMLQINCSKGTYIRSICNDIGDMLGCGAYMSFLIRTATGRFNLENSHVLEEITNRNIEELLVGADFCLDFDSVTIPSANRSKILNGNATYCKNNKNNNTGKLVKIYLDTNEFVGIGKIDNHILSIEKLMIKV